MSVSETLGLFEGVGLELEYMIVGADDLDVRPIADLLLQGADGAYEQEAQFGNMGWSNELALHVVEIKNVLPVPGLQGLGELFQTHVARINDRLETFGARLLPTAMHPWMDPQREFAIWPHGDRVIYETFDRIFKCSGHGWANLQSVHLNLPFSNDDEFGRLHAAIRMVLPIIPALAASSPLADGRVTGYLDTRLEMYRHNAARVPSVSGKVIPEAAFSRADYQENILERIYADLAPHDPAGVLRYEWVNSRGCIARFDRMAIEVRVIDSQECPQADAALAAALSSVIRALVEERRCSYQAQKAWSEDELRSIFVEVVRDADHALIHDTRYLDMLGAGNQPRSARDLWQHLIEETLAREPGYAEWEPALSLIGTQGCLAQRILADVGREPTRETMSVTYGRLADCLQTGVLFRADP